MNVSPNGRTDAPDRERALEVIRIEGHDLRSPLANIRSYASMILARRDALDPRIRRAAEIIVKNADRGLRLIDEWMDLLRSSHARLELARTACPIPALARMALSDEQEEFDQKGVRVKTEFDDDLPAVEVDPSRIRRAIAALLTAARSRAPEGSTVHLRTRREGDRIRIEVEDEGPRPSREEADHFYDAEFQMLAHRRMEPGLEMALARAVAEAHGGEAGAEPVEGGAVHYLDLPLPA